MVFGTGILLRRIITRVRKPLVFVVSEFGIYTKTAMRFVMCHKVEIYMYIQKQRRKIRCWKRRRAERLIPEIHFVCVFVCASHSITFIVLNADFCHGLFVMVTWMGMRGMCGSGWVGGRNGTHTSVDACRHWGSTGVAEGRPGTQVSAYVNRNELTVVSAEKVFLYYVLLRRRRQMLVICLSVV